MTYAGEVIRTGRHADGGKIGVATAPPASEISMVLQGDTWWPI